MAVDVLTETVIDRPVTEVAAYAAEPDNASRWYANIASVEWMSPPPLRLGSRVTFQAHFLGRTLRYTYEVVEYEPGALGDAHRAGAVPDGDHLHLGADRRRRYADDVAQSRRTVGLLPGRHADDGACDAAGQPR
ncbi:hypothetical protein KRM28CT15_46520 [Krasilnikovia sp. M28-CT-15]